ncbi:hypothetical protein ACR75P_05150 [Faecalicoccus pleomorphus]|uniref:hypothetical protein n=1 Tax=Faecalicoccus pleomorphus TaxID=1323 RepID=UPI003DA32A00
MLSTESKEIGFSLSFLSGLGLKDYVSVLSLLLSFLALYNTRKVYKIGNIRGLYKELFEDKLLKELPQMIYNFLDDLSEDNYQSCIDSILEVKNKIYFFKFYNSTLYEELKYKIVIINEDIENLMQYNESISKAILYRESIEYHFREFYTLVYQIPFFKLCYFEILNKLNTHKIKKKIKEEKEK